MARYNKVTGKFEGTSGRNIDSRTKRFWKVASRSRTTGKDIKRKAKFVASKLMNGIIPTLLCLVATESAWQL